MNIALIGGKASGKTTICRLLAKRLDKNIVSVEDEIKKKTKVSMQSFIKKYDLSKFCDIECEIIERISDFDDCVLDTTHSTVMRNENVTNLKKNSIVVLLTADAKTIASRFKAGDGELMQNSDDYGLRCGNAADYSIDTSRLSPDEICDLITHYLQAELR